MLLEHWDQSVVLRYSRNANARFERSRKVHFITRSRCLIVITNAYSYNLASKRIVLCKITKWILWTHFIYKVVKDKLEPPLRKVNAAASYSRPVYCENNIIFLSDVKNINWQTSTWRIFLHLPKYPQERTSNNPTLTVSRSSNTWKLPRRLFQFTPNHHPRTCIIIRSKPTLLRYLYRCCRCEFSARVRSFKPCRMCKLHFTWTPIQIGRRKQTPNWWTGFGLLVEARWLIMAEKWRRVLWLVGIISN